MTTSSVGSTSGCASGVIEPSAAAAVREVRAHPEWLRADGPHHRGARGRRRDGAAAGADAAGAPGSPRSTCPARRCGSGSWTPPGSALGRWCSRCRPGRRTPTRTVRGRPGRGAPAVADWLAGLDGRLVVGNYVYADGATNVRVSVAVDVLSARLPERSRRRRAGVPGHPHRRVRGAGGRGPAEHRRLRGRSTRAKALGRPLRAVSGPTAPPRLRPGRGPRGDDSLVPQQGPNYALAKRLQRWRATVARDAGGTVSMNVAPPTRTRSVVKNRALAAAYAGAHRFGVEVFEPATSNVLMAALLVHDLHTGGGPRTTCPGRTRRTARCTVVSGVRRTPRAARSGWPPCSGTARRGSPGTSHGRRAPGSVVPVAAPGGLQRRDVALAGVLLGVDLPGHGEPAAGFGHGREPVPVPPRVEAVQERRGVLDAVP